MAGRLRLPLISLSAMLTSSFLKNAISTARERVYLMGKGFLMTTGTVKWFNAEKGFGFIAPDTGGADAFVHVSALDRSGVSELREGQKLTFELVADRKSGKMTADNLKARD